MERHQLQSCKKVCITPTYTNHIEGNMNAETVQDAGTLSIIYSIFIDFSH